ncbi:MAG TPA: class I poly(R)-hydroxyalkanoic acid synthase [Acidocella sp.]|nr:class I poly(R)-hydroxyalkanoic acid synthase [Acidocella sp.]
MTKSQTRENSAGMPPSPASAFPGPEPLGAAWRSWVDALSQVSNGQLMRQFDDRLAKNAMLRAGEEALNANPLHDVIPIDWAEIARALRTVWLLQLTRPERAISTATQLNLQLFQSSFEIWTEAAQRWCGMTSSSAAGGESAGSGDKRFAASEWHHNPVYRTLKEFYLMASAWLLHQPAGFGDMTAAERQRLNFHLRQFVDAVSPTLVPLLNPVAVRRALETGGVSLADGVRNLMHDLAEGRLSMVDTEAFAPGRNLALSPGKVVYRNKLIELIQYEPKTAQVHQMPLLIFPPWINKFYIMDLQPRNSMVRYLVEAGFTVFMTSWKNPDASMEGTTIEDYVEQGQLAASDVVREITGSPTVNVVGYCIGGTLLAMTLALLAARGDKRFNAASFIVSLQDFAKVGDTALFLGEGAIDFIEEQMLERGYLDSRQMSDMFNLLRSNDLIWSNVVNNYILGQKPPAFDLLYWNNDGTRMARTAHSWYLRNTYIENNLIQPGKTHLMGEALDLRRITLDSYAVGAERDHIVPWESAWRLTQLTGGTVRFVLASSGHIAGIINPPGSKNAAYWTTKERRAAPKTPHEWRGHAKRYEDSWWGDWSAWLAARAGAMAQPPALGSAAYPPLCDAPGTYVMEK